MTQQVPLNASARADGGVGPDGTHEIATDLAYLRCLISNVVYVGRPDAGDRGWVLVDAGVVGTGAAIRAAAAARFGNGARPAALLLTHGHFDHVGVLEDLAAEWDVPVFAHELERPYLDGSAAYPPGDPEVGGGMMTRLSPLFPTRPVDVADRLQTLPADGTIPLLPGWRWIHTPGHSPGHVSFWRESDKALIVGDAFVTTASESAYASAVQQAEMHGPPRYFTIDWDLARASVTSLAALCPALVVTGHGRAMAGPEMQEALATLARNFDAVAKPDRGRFVRRSAKAADGSAYLKPSFKGMRMKRHKPLAQQVIVITGASSGIGLAAARSAAAAGARVMLASRNEAALSKIVRDIRDAGGEARYVVTDVSSRADVEALAAETLRAYGRFDTWVNNAGLSIFGRIAEITDADHRRLFDINFWGVVHGSTVAAGHLKKSGGALINLGSIASDLAFPLQGMYCASKHAIKGFTDAFRMEMQEDGAPFTLTLIKPAAIDTPFVVHAKNYMNRMPVLPPPVYHPQDVADAILYAAEKGPRDIYVGGGGKAMSVMSQLMPRATDWVGANVVSKIQLGKTAPKETTDSLYGSGPDGSTRGSYPGHVMRSAYTHARFHPIAAGAVLACLGLAASSLLGQRQRR